MAIDSEGHTGALPRQDQESDDDHGNDRNGLNQNSENTDSVESSDEDIDDLPLHKCEIQSYEARFTAKGTRDLVVVDKSEKEGDDSSKEDKKYAICSYKFYSRSGEFERGHIEIHSPFINTALQQVIKTYPGSHFMTDSSITIEYPYRCIFHYRQELTAYKDDPSNVKAEAHIALLLQFMQDELHESIRSYMSSVENAIDTPSIGYSNLWMIYKPGQLVFTGNDDNLHVLEIVNSWERKGSCPAYFVRGKYFTHDGKDFGYAYEDVGIAPYIGVKPISQLSIMPEAFHFCAEIVKKSLVARGRKFCALRGSHYRSYNGLVSALSKVRNWNQDGQWREEPMKIKSRIMVDTEMFNVVKASNKINLNEIKSIPDDGSDEYMSRISERDFMLSSWRIPGYAFLPKRWCWFSVNHVESVIFSHEAFDTLMLPARQKQIVHSLVTTHVSKVDEFDDLIAGKGKGLIYVLHGSPGLGKTFTAESVADHIERPLYVLNSGELGIEPTEVEENLNWALMLATQWNAILLIDEADVFLEERNVHDLKRNCLVSLFLRTLEYYEGILFLTTNRITTFDPAFRSRIHLALKYQDLSVESKKELWRSFISRTAKKPPVFSDATLTKLGKIDLNGRQIKNIVRTANALARSAGEELGESHMMEVVESIREFEKDFDGEQKETSTMSGD